VLAVPVFAGALRSALGTLVAVLVVSLEVHHQSGLRRQEEKIKVMVEMNHHIRNALQTIVYVNSTNPDKISSDRLSAAANRIEWALREVLPGKQMEGGEDHSFREER
jgi:hypothetical protein